MRNRGYNYWHEPCSKIKVMNKLISFLITIYIISILAWSGLVRAESVTINNAIYDNKNLMLILEGHTNTSCGISIQTEIRGPLSIDVNTKVLVEVVKNKDVDMCVTLESNTVFSKVIDVRSLGLSAGVYEISLVNKVSNNNESFDFLVNIPQNSYYPSFELVERSGLLTKSENGDWILVSNEGSPITLKTELDLSRYTGHRVLVEGSEILHRMGPGFKVGEHSPLRAELSSGNPTVFLFTISTVMY